MVGDTYEALGNEVGRPPPSEMEVARHPCAIITPNLLMISCALPFGNFIRRLQRMPGVILSANRGL